MTTALIIAASVLMAGAIAWLIYQNKRVWSVIKGVEIAITAKGIDMKFAKLRSPGLFGSFPKTQFGVQVISTVVIPKDAMNTIDSAFTESIRRIGKIFPSWKKGMTHTDCKIVFIDPMANNPPSLVTAGIKTAGSVLKPNNLMGDACVIVPHQEGIGWSRHDYLFNSIYNEREHQLARINDLAEFDKGVVAGHIHPLYPDDRPQAVSLRQAEPFSCGVEEKV